MLALGGVPYLLIYHWIAKSTFVATHATFKGKAQGVHVQPIHPLELQRRRGDHTVMSVTQSISLFGLTGTWTGIQADQTKGFVPQTHGTVTRRSFKNDMNNKRLHPELSCSRAIA